jgi:hypothetical protein
MFTCTTDENSSRCFVPWSVKKEWVPYCTGKLKSVLYVLKRFKRWNINKINSYLTNYGQNAYF